MYNDKQRKNVTKMIEQARKDIWKMEKKINKIKLWLDVYETLVYGDIELVQDNEEETTEEILKEIDEENPEDPEGY
jgi:GH25 family lysozyme M1 (1,4-beta-N-acetylmuramidase)